MATKKEQKAGNVEEPTITGLSPTNLKSNGYFYRLYSTTISGQQLADLNHNKIVPQLVAQLVCVPWGHHMLIIDKCKRNRDKALFYVRRTIQNGWSRNSLLNWLSTDLYEFKKVLPTKAQLAKCVADAERQIAGGSMARRTNPPNFTTICEFNDDQ